ncbi:MAG: hypothetical protein QOJ46_1785 [bacterium]|jgi:hypothetical protein
MSAARRFIDDLVDKRLWPVVLLLAVAVVAIPVLIGGSSEPAGPPDAAVSPAAARIAAATPAVELVGPAEVRSRPGKLRDPFRRTRHKVAKRTANAPAAKVAPANAVPKTGGSVSKAPASSSPATPKAPSNPSSPSSPSTPSTTVPVEPSAAANARSVFQTVAHVAGPHADYEHPLARLAVVGDKDSPALQYLGVSRGGEYAIFLLGPSATAAGNDGACIVAQPCRAIGVRRGETLKIEVADPGSAARQYSVKVTSLHRVTLPTPAAAQRERARVAKGGRAVLRTIAEDVPTAGALGQLRYGPATGTVTLSSAP